MKKTLLTTLLLGLSLACANANGSLIEKLSANPVKTKGFNAITWSADGEGFTTFENGKNGGTEIVRYEAKDNTRTILVPEELFIDTKTQKHIGVRSFQWSQDNSKLLIFTNTRKVWRYHTKGDYWLLDMNSKSLKKLGASMPQSEMMFAKLSPDATKVGYVVNNNIYCENLIDGKITQLTKDGGQRFVNGTFDWVYEEEFSCRDGFRFSEDSKWIAFWNSDTQGTGSFQIINNVDSIYSFVNTFPYPKAGTANSAVKVGYVATDGGQITWFDIDGDPRNNYIPRMEFIPGTNELIIQQMNRQQNTNRVHIATIGNNKPVNIFTDNDTAWLDTNNDIKWLKDNKYFTWESDRSGWRHIYMISKDGKEIIPVTKGDYDVVKQAGLDTKSGYIYYIASPDSPIERYLYRTKLFSNNEPELISDKQLVGHHSYDISPSASWAVHYFSNATTPTQIEMLSLPKNKTVRVIETNQEAKEQYKALGLIDKEYVRIDLNNVTLDAWIIKPVGFDSTKKYPVIVKVYSEPATSTVQNVWSGSDMTYQALAQMGYVVVSIDSRGVNLPRGREWRKCIYGSVGVLSAKDQAQGIMKLAQMKGYIDTERIGITGHSGGGSMTLHCMFRYPEIFKTGISLAFVADQRTYDTIYQERYMDTPQNNPEGYKVGSPINYASGLKGNLLLIHGTGDDNVHYQNFELMSNELIRQGKIFWSISYPMRTHSLNEGAGTARHITESTNQFWRTYLPAGAR